MFKVPQRRMESFLRIPTILGDSYMSLIMIFSGNVVFMVSGAAGEKAKGGSCDGFQVADTQYDFVTTDRLYQSDLFEPVEEKT